MHNDVPSFQAGRCRGCVLCVEWLVLRSRPDGREVLLCIGDSTSACACHVDSQACMNALLRKCAEGALHSEQRGPALCLCCRVVSASCQLLVSAPAHVLYFRGSCRCILWSCSSKSTSYCALACQWPFVGVWGCLVVRVAGLVGPCFVVV